jgi:hypothetical protein
MAALLKCNDDNSVDKPSYGGGPLQNGDTIGLPFNQNPWLPHRHCLLAEGWRACRAN